MEDEERYRIEVGFAWRRYAISREQKKPDYVHDVIWEEYQQHCRDLDLGKHDADRYRVDEVFERAIFGAGMVYAWNAFESARKKYYKQHMTEEEREIFGARAAYKTMALHLESLAVIRFNDFSKQLPPAKQSKLYADAEQKGRVFLAALKACYAIPNIGFTREEKFIGQLEEMIEELESEAFFSKTDSCVLLRTDIKNPHQTYLIRYLSDSFFSMFKIKSLKSAIARFVGAALDKEVTDEDVKNALRGYPVYGIRKRFWDEG